jgi:hypothetical protein
LPPAERAAIIADTSVTVDTQTTDSIGKLVLEAQSTESKICMFKLSFDSVLLTNSLLETQNVPLKFAATNTI